MTARYRGHVDAPRTRQVRLRFTQDELATVSRAADFAGLTPSGYAAEAALAAARGIEAPALAPWREVMSQLLLTRGQLRRIGTNLNQAARVLNVEGEAPVWLERTCAITERSIVRVDETTDYISRLARRRRVMASPLDEEASRR